MLDSMLYCYIHLHYITTDTTALEHMPPCTWPSSVFLFLPFPLSLARSRCPQLQMAFCPRGWQLPPPPLCRWHGSVPRAPTLLGHCAISSRWRTRPPSTFWGESPSSSTATHTPIRLCRTHTCTEFHTSCTCRSLPSWRDLELFLIILRILSYTG